MSPAVLLPALLVTVATLASCGGQGSQGGAAAGSASAGSCGRIPRALEGSYYARTTRGELPPEVADAPTGVNLLLLGPEHHAFYRIGDRFEHYWPVCVTRGRLLTVPPASSGPCADQGPATYRWRIGDATLELVRSSDNCLPRVFAWTSKPLRRFNESGWNCHSRPDCGHKLEQIELLERTGSCDAAGCSGAPPR